MFSEIHIIFNAKALNGVPGFWHDCAKLHRPGVAWRIQHRGGCTMTEQGIVSTAFCQTGDREH